MQIVGVIDDIKEGPLEGANWPALYVLLNQNPVAWPAVLVRSSRVFTIHDSRFTIHQLEGPRALITIN